MYVYNNTFVHIITTTYGNAGIQWITQLPAILEQCTRQWNLTNLTPYPNLTYGYVLAGMQDLTPVVLKVQYDTVRFQKERAALEVFHGYGSVGILQFDTHLKALLLERAAPGTSLVALFPQHDEQAVVIASKVIQKLHQAHVPHDHHFPTLQQVLGEFNRSLPLTAPFIEKAQRLKEHLFATTTTHVLLHGDVHYDNIISHGQEWRIIDPEGIIGDPVYEVSVCIRHPLTQLLQASDPKKIIQARIANFATQLGWDPQRVYDWTYVQTVAAACWSLEDGLDATRHVAFLTLLHGIERMRVF